MEIQDTNAAAFGRNGRGSYFQGVEPRDDDDEGIAHIVVNTGAEPAGFVPKFLSVFYHYIYSNRQNICNILTMGMHCHDGRKENKKKRCTRIVSYLR
jgi:hypothetical protein